MFRKARVTSKGQVTLPVDLRRDLDIKAGDDLVFDDSTDRLTLHVVHRKRLSEYRGALAIESEALDPADERTRAGHYLADRHR